MRSAIAFRLKQEYRNYWMFLRPPVPAVALAPNVSFLSDPAEVCAAVRGTPYAETIVALTK
jgi:hypothetical protein